MISSSDLERKSKDGSLTLGEFLRQERLVKGITLEQVSSATKVGLRQLQAIESDHYLDLPAKPFIRGFIKAYCQFIGLDAKEILTCYGNYIDKKTKEIPQEKQSLGEFAFERKDRDQSRTILGIVMGAFVVIGGLVLIFIRPSLKHKHTSHIEKLKSIQTTVSTPTQAPITLLQQTAPGQITLNNTKTEIQNNTADETKEVDDPLQSGIDLKPSEIVHRVSFRANESIWIRYQVDDKKIRQFIIRKDNILVLRARNRIAVQVSHPDNVSYNYNRTGSKQFAKAKNLISDRYPPTLYFPLQESGETLEEEYIFSNMGSIHQKVVPPPRAQP